MEIPKIVKIRPCSSFCLQGDSRNNVFVKNGTFVFTPHETFAGYYGTFPRYMILNDIKVFLHEKGLLFRPFCCGWPCILCYIIDLITETSLKCKKVTPEICLGPFQRLVTLSFVGGIHKLRWQARVRDWRESSNVNDTT